MAQTKSRRTPSGNERFASAPTVSNPRSTFNRSQGWRSTLDGGWLYPCLWEEVLPGDTFNLRTSHFTRFQTMLRPIFDNIYVTFFFFFVPDRLTDENWEKFMGEKDNPGDTTVYVTPKITSPGPSGYANGSIYDNFGLPTQVAGITHRAAPLRAYNQIIKEWFRSQDLVDSPPIHTGTGPDEPADYTLLKRSKRPDYFTSSLPTPQRGPDVLLPLGDSAPVVAEGTGIPVLSGSAMTSLGGSGANITTGAAVGNLTWTDPALEADLSQASAATINQIRQSFQIQKFYERSMRGGARYTETIQAFFGVTSPDQRLQRPEYLGGGRTTMNVHPVPQTSVTSALGAQADLSAYGTLAGAGQGFVKSFTEHGNIIGLVSIHADLTYQQGLERKWSRDTRFDFFWMTFAHIGEQEILSKEIYADGSGDDDLVFGYAERYAEYRFALSRICGKFRSNDALTLDIWHVSQFFASRPVLNQSFIEENPPFDRVIAVTDESQFFMDVWFDIKAARAMPVYGIPGLVDHF